MDSFFAWRTAWNSLPHELQKVLATMALNIRQPLARPQSVTVRAIMEMMEIARPLNRHSSYSFLLAVLRRFSCGGFCSPGAALPTPPAAFAASSCCCFPFSRVVPMAWSMRSWSFSDSCFTWTFKVLVAYCTYPLTSSLAQPLGRSLSHRSN